jgi:hypothetical protein
MGCSIHKLAQATQGIQVFQSGLWLESGLPSHRHVVFTLSPLIVDALIRHVEADIKDHVRATPYHGDITVVHSLKSCYVRVRPNSTLSRIFSLHPLFKLLLSIICVYPALVLLKWLFWGAKWDGSRAAYDLRSRGFNEVEWLNRQDQHIQEAVRSRKRGDLRL